MKKILLGVFLFLMIISNSFADNHWEIKQKIDVVYPGEQCFWKIYHHSDKIFIWSPDLSQNNEETLTMTVQKALLNTEVWEKIELRNYPWDLAIFDYSLIFLDENKNIIATDAYWVKHYWDLKDVEVDFVKYSAKIQQQKDSQMIMIISPALFIFFILSIIIVQNRIRVFSVWLYWIYLTTIIFLPYWIQVENYDFILAIHVFILLVTYIINKKYFHINVKNKKYSWLILFFIIYCIAMLLIDKNYYDQETFVVVYPYFTVIIGWIINSAFFLCLYLKYLKKEQ